MLQSIWPFSGAEKQRRKLLSAISDNEAAFEEAVACAQAFSNLGPELSRFIEKTTGEFRMLKQCVESASSSLPDPESLLRKADALGRRRAYVIPASRIELEARTILAELREWRVPDAVVSDLDATLKATFPPKAPDSPAQRPSEETSRAALSLLFEAHDYWDWYVTWYFGIRAWLVACLLGAALVAFLVSLSALHIGSVLLGFFCAGLCGTAVSILLKLPPLSVYGDAVDFIPRIFARLAAGMVGSAVGCGLLAAGIINIGVPTGGVSTAGVSRTLTVPEMMLAVLENNDCARYWHESGAHQKSTQPWQRVLLCDPPGIQRQPPQPSPAEVVVCSAEGSIPTMTLDAGGKGRALPFSESEIDRLIAILLSLGILVGFGERALTSFEDVLFRAPRSEK